MAGQRERLAETLAAPDMVIATVLDGTVFAYHRLYESTPVTRKYLVVIVKASPEDAFVLTAYFTSRIKRGQMIWHP
jgi:molybdopterin synthase catalytic subunit